jgi:hypothetical protein
MKLATRLGCHPGDEGPQGEINITTGAGPRLKASIISPGV